MGITEKVLTKMIETKLILSLIFCFHTIDAGFRDALDKHSILTLSDFASQMRLNHLNTLAIDSETHEKMKIGQKQLDDLKRREEKLSGTFNALRNIFDIEK